MAICQGLVGLTKVQSLAIQGYGAPPDSFKPADLGQLYFDFNVTPPTPYLWNGQTWRSVTVVLAAALSQAVSVAVKSLIFSNSPYNVIDSDYLLSVNSSGGAITINLPAATAVPGRVLVIRDVGGMASTNKITISGGGTNLVGASASTPTKILPANYSGATVISDGKVWSYAVVN